MADRAVPLPHTQPNLKHKKELFGELGLLSKDYSVHPTTVRAKGFCRVLQVRARDFSCVCVCVICFHFISGTCFVPVTT
eukprot:COSAG06_NODE_12530_length_1368_cov_1.520095_1_plen_78_part_10